VLKRRIDALLLASLAAQTFGCAAQRSASPLNVDPSIWSIRSCGTHRIIVQRRCNPDHCFTDAFLQSQTGGTSSIEVPIKEVNEHVSAFVAVTGLDKEVGSCVFVLDVVEPHTGDALFTLRVEPQSDGIYSAKQVDAPN
jgi:hypothetical protein